MNKIFALAVAAAAFAMTSGSAEAREYCHPSSYHYRPTYRRVVIVQPAYGYRSDYNYRGRYEDRSCDRHDYHHHRHGLRGVVPRFFR